MLKVKRTRSFRGSRKPSRNRGLVAGIYQQWHTANYGKVAQTKKEKPFVAKVLPPMQTQPRPIIYRVALVLPK